MVWKMLPMAIVAAIAMAMANPCAAADGTFPPSMIASWAEEDATYFNDNAASLDGSIISMGDLAKLMNAKTAIATYGTLAVQPNTEFPMYLSYFTRELAVTSYQDSDGNTVVLDTTQQPDYSFVDPLDPEQGTLYDVYGVTASSQDWRRDLTLWPLLFASGATSQVRGLIRNLVTARLSAASTSHFKVWGMLALAYTQRDTAAVEAIIAPYQSDSNGWVRLKAAEALSILRLQPKA